jgi:hypothetical protein
MPLLSALIMKAVKESIRLLTVYLSFVAFLTATAAAFHFLFRLLR